MSFGPPCHQCGSVDDWLPGKDGEQCRCGWPQNGNYPSMMPGRMFVAPAPWDSLSDTPRRPAWSKNLRIESTPHVDLGSIESVSVTSIKSSVYPDTHYIELRGGAMVANFEVGEVTLASISEVVGMLFAAMQAHGIETMPRLDLRITAKSS